MAKIISIDEHFQHFLTDLKESFWGDLEAVPGSGRESSKEPQESTENRG